MKYTIYQLKDIRNCDYGFMEWEFANSHNFSMSDYKEVYSGDFDGKDCRALDSLYETFNLNHPEDFRGHSMSVSDVVALHDTEKHETKVYYCDTFGWKDITKTVNIQNRMSQEEMIEYLLEELEYERSRMLEHKDNKYGYIFMLCNDMGIIGS